MPLKSLDTSVLKWPDRETVLKALDLWGRNARSEHPELERLGMFGSYVRGDAGVGSDLDLVAIVTKTSLPFEQRTAEWDLNSLPVSAGSLCIGIWVL